MHLLQTYLLPAVEYTRENLQEIVGSVNSALVISCLNLINYQMTPLFQKDSRPLPHANVLDLISK